MMTNKKIFVISISVIIIIGIFIFLLNISKPNQVTSSNPTQIAKSEVAISTDKDIYTKGETINIFIKNGLDENILYNPSGDRFWSIEYYEDDKWKKFGYDGREGFQLTDENIGDNCYIALYELSYPVELQSRSNLNSQWNQKICPFGKDGPDKPSIVQYIESEKYRFSFSYGFEMFENDPFRISEPKTVYSNIITIK